MDDTQRGGLNWLPLLCGLALMFGLTAYPKILETADGRADHLAALLAAWAMSAGLIRGVGFVPRMRLWRWLFSGWGCAVALTLATLKLAL